MEDDPVQRLAKANRVSIRAVLVSDHGTDTQAALTKAGIYDPVAIPVRLGDGSDLSIGFMGDGLTPNLTGILESNEPDIPQSEPASREPASSKRDSSARYQPTPVNLPAAFGGRPMAPARKRPV